MSKHKIFSVLWVLWVCAGLTACIDLDEDPKGALVTNNFFKTPNDLDGAVVGVFNPLITGWGAFNSGWSYVPLMGGDDITHHPYSSKRVYREFDIFNASPNNDALRRTWSQLYQSIMACNTVDVHCHLVNTSDKVKNEALAQVYFVRALCYFHLVQIFGDIPLLLAPEVDLEIGKTSTAGIYAQITKDLEFAETYLPETWTDPGRPTLAAAKALLAKVYLTMAGWPLKQEGMYAKASAKAKEVIDLDRYELLPDYADLWKLDNGNNIESIFSFQHSKTTGSTFWLFGLATQPEAEEGGWDDIFSEIRFFYDFPEGPRKDATFYTVFKKKVGDEVVLIPWEESIQKNPYYRKFRDGAVDEENPWDAEMGADFKMPYIRYADLLLIYAEAKCMSAGPDASAYDAVNRVRNRAGLPNLPKGLSQIAFRDSVIAERGWELACERHRWFDLVRTEKVEEVAAKRSPEDVPLHVQPTKDNYLAPIPQREVDKNPNLK